MWTLLLARVGDPPGAYMDRRQIDGGTLVIGRDVRKCDWVLPDDRGHVSRAHCSISVAGFDLFVTDTSTNGTGVNAPQPRIPPGQPVPVRMGDRLYLGDYLIDIASETAAAGVALTPTPPPLSLATPAGQGIWAAGEVDPLWSGNKPGDPFGADVHEFLGNAMDEWLAPSSRQAAPAVDIGWNGAMGAAFSKPILAASAPPASNAFAIPDDWMAPAAAPAALADPFAPARPDPFAKPDPFAAAKPDPFAAPAADPFAKAPPDPFGAADPFVPPADPFGGSGGGAGFAGDPFAGFDLPAQAPAAPAYQPPAPTPAPAALPAAPRAAGAAMGGAEWAAFCEGAGLDAGDLKLAPDAMHRLGVLYRQVVLGLTDLIQDRAAFKDEFRVERSVLMMGRNNPLKHMPPLDTARLLLGDPLPGFMSADESIRGAFEDIKKHQLAMLAGVQHALQAVFERLEPAEIERLIAKAAGAKRGLLDRKPDAWTVYRTVFEALRVDATNNVNSVMSMAFRDGYEAFMKGQA